MSTDFYQEAAAAKDKGRLQHIIRFAEKLISLLALSILHDFSRACHHEFFCDATEGEL